MPGRSPALCGMLVVAVLAQPVPGKASQIGQPAGYRVDLTLVPNLESLRRLFEECTDLGALEPSRRSLEEAVDLEQLRPAVEPLGVVRLNGCSIRVQGIPGVSPLGGLLPDTEADAGEVCTLLDGAVLMNREGEYFGTITSEVASDSIFNAFGPFGSALSPTSIWNQFGVGGQVRSDSPWNPFERGLLIVKNAEMLGRLTVNTTVPDWVHPLTLAARCFAIPDREDPNQPTARP